MKRVSLMVLIIGYITGYIIGCHVAIFIIRHASAGGIMCAVPTLYIFRIYCVCRQIVRHSKRMQIVHYAVDTPYIYCSSHHRNDFFVKNIFGHEVMFCQFLAHISNISTWSDSTSAIAEWRARFKARSLDCLIIDDVSK